MRNLSPTCNVLKFYIEIVGSQKQKKKRLSFNLLFCFTLPFCVVLTLKDRKACMRTNIKCQSNEHSSLVSPNG